MPSVVLLLPNHPCEKLPAQTWQLPGCSVTDLPKGHVLSLQQISQPVDQSRHCDPVLNPKRRALAKKQTETVKCSWCQMPIIGLNFSDQQIFEGLNLVLPAWALLVIAPRWRVTHWVVNLTTFGFCVLYTGLFATLMLQSETTFDFTGFFTYEVNNLPRCPSHMQGEISDV